jgi:very-short-patch-repair endonuclease
VAERRDAYDELNRIARRRSQRGHFTSSQAEGAGMSRMQLKRLVDRGLVERAATRVYRFRLSATALYKLSDPPSVPSVLVRRSGRGAAGRHTTRTLPISERVIVDGLPALSPVRAVLDSVHRMPRADAVAMVESAIVRALVSPERLRRRAAELAHSKRPGCAVTLQILADLHPELARSRNEWEAHVVRRAKELGLPAPRLEYELLIDGHRYIADAAWPEQRVALEFDGRDPHMRRRVHDHDNDRRNDFLDAGWKRFGITAGALKRGDDRAFRLVARALTNR